MLHHTPLITIIVAGIGLAFVLGALAQRLRISPLVGYLLAGVMVGPFTPGFVADRRAKFNSSRGRPPGRPSAIHRAIDDLPTALERGLASPVRAGEPAQSRKPKYRGNQRMISGQMMQNARAIICRATNGMMPR